MERPKVLVVEDERKIVDLIALYLQKEGYETCPAGNGEEALKIFAQVKPVLVILDLMLPKLDGLEVCRRLRQISTVPIIMLTAKDEEADKVIGLGLGADDYVTKPFSPRELLARVKAVLRRALAWKDTTEEELGNDHLRVNVARRQIWQGGQEVHITALEFDLLVCLMRSPNRVYTRDQLLSQVWGDSFFGDSRVVDVHIGNLRRKVEPDPSSPVFIKTVRDVGYKFQDGE